LLFALWVNVGRISVNHSNNRCLTPGTAAAPTSFAS
jgi:hypothetical protein